MERLKLKAVHDHDLVGLLKSLGILELVQSGQMECLYCGQAVTMENLHSLVPGEQGIALTCDRPSCVEATLLHPHTK